MELHTLYVACSQRMAGDKTTPNRKVGERFWMMLKNGEKQIKKEEKIRRVRDDKLTESGGGGGGVLGTGNIGFKSVIFLMRLSTEQTNITIETKLSKRCEIADLAFRLDIHATVDCTQCTSMRPRNGSKRSSHLYHAGRNGNPQYPHIFPKNI